MFLLDSPKGSARARGCSSTDAPVSWPHSPYGLGDHRQVPDANVTSSSSPITPSRFDMPAPSRLTSKIIWRKGGLSPTFMVFEVLREVLLKVLRVAQDLRGRSVPPPRPFCCSSGSDYPPSTRSFR